MAITYNLSIQRLAWYNDGHAIKLKNKWLMKNHHDLNNNR